MNVKAIFVLLAALIFSPTYAQEVAEGEHDEVPAAQSSVSAKPLDLSFLYPMTAREVRTAAERLELPSLSRLAGEWQERTPPLLATSRFLSCDKETLSINYWLVSDHENKSRSKQLNEKNRGVGVFYSCDGWSGGYDQMRNSNYGKAKLISVFWGRQLLEVGPVRIFGKGGYGRVAYGVPKHDITLYENSKLAFVGAGIKQLPGFSVNVAKVPKTAGKAYILWVSYELIRFQR